MKFVPNQPVTTAEAFVDVDAGLPIGEHRFRLVVVDRAGLSSQPAEVIVTIAPVVVGPIVTEPVRPGPIFDPDPVVVPVRPVGPTGPVGPVGPITDPIR